MKRIAALLFVAGMCSGVASAAENFTPAPTVPQVPTPRLAGSSVVAVGSDADRPRESNRERIRLVQATAPATNLAVPLPTSYPMAVPTGASCAVGNCADQNCGQEHRTGSCCARIKAWFCYQPTTKGALPKCRPHPYVGPITGTFGCSDAGGSSCGSCGVPGCSGTGPRCNHGHNLHGHNLLSGKGYGNGNGSCDENGAGNGHSGSLLGKGGLGHGALAARLGLGGDGGRWLTLGGLGCKGECVPAAENAVPGYKFSTYKPPSLTPIDSYGETRLMESTSYKPTTPSNSQLPAVQATPRSLPKSADSNLRPFARQ